MRFHRLLLALTALALAAPVFADGGLSVNVKYAGTGYDTTVEWVEDGFPVNLTHARGKGTFGNSTIAITAEFVYDESVIEHCPAGYVLPFAVVPGHLWATVITASDHSQVYGLFDEGWICLTEDQLDWVGETSGFYFGGSGRYECATGNWVSHFQGTNLDASVGFRSITGDFQGTLYLDCD
jgi:hypothetical protein